MRPASRMSGWSTRCRVGRHHAMAAAMIVPASLRRTHHALIQRCRQWPRSASTIMSTARMGTAGERAAGLVDTDTAGTPLERSRLVLWYRPEVVVERRAENAGIAAHDEHLLDRMRRANQSHVDDFETDAGD